MSESKIDSQENGNQPSLDERINSALQAVDDKGKIKFEDNVDPLFKRAVLGEQKARFFQTDYTKTKQENARLQAEHGVLMNKATSGSSLSAEQTAELEDLKFVDPDAWFELKNKYDADAKANVTGRLQEQLSEAGSKALQDLTLSQRQVALQEFTASTGLELTDDVMQNDIPPRLQKKMETMPFDDYLQEVATYLGKGKVVKQTDSADDVTNINDIAGGDLNEAAKSTGYQIL